MGDLVATLQDQVTSHRKAWDWDGVTKNGLHKFSWSEKMEAALAFRKMPKLAPPASRPRHVQETSAARTASVGSSAGVLGGPLAGPTTTITVTRGPEEILLATKTTVENSKVAADPPRPAANLVPSAGSNVHPPKLLQCMAEIDSWRAGKPHHDLEYLEACKARVQRHTGPEVARAGWEKLRKAWRNRFNFVNRLKVEREVNKVVKQREEARKILRRA